MENNEDKDALFDEAIRLEKRGDWDRAIALYEQGRSSLPDESG